MRAIWFDDYEWYIATSAEDAARQQEELTGERIDEYEFQRVPYWRVIEIYQDDSRQQKPWRLWVWVWLILRRPGFLAGTEY